LLKAKLAGASQEGDKTIAYKILETGEEKTVRLTNEEADANEGKISRISPVGMALNNRGVGEIVEVQTSQKNYKVQILRIEEK
jgi:transcription elongation GreA/GreB family factor